MTQEIWDQARQIEELEQALTEAQNSLDRAHLQPEIFWLRTAQALHTTLASLYKMNNGERIACLRVLRHVKYLNDKGIYPQKISDMNPGVAVQAQAIAAKFPCLLESYPRWRLTQYGRLVLRDAKTQSQTDESAQK